MIVRGLFRKMQRREPGAEKTAQRLISPLREFLQFLSIKLKNLITAYTSHNALMPDPGRESFLEMVSCERMIRVH